MRLLAVRLLAAPVWLGLALLVTTVSPLLAALARLAAKLSGRREPLALARLLCVYVMGELAVLASTARLWLASGGRARLGAGAYRERHYGLLRQLLDELVAAAMGSLRLRLQVDPDPAAAAALADPSRPLLVFSRHAGPGDSILLLHALLTHFDREPRVVMKEIIALDPVVGLYGLGLPNALIDATADEASGAIRELATGLDGRAALLLFPEGGNFTEQRRSSAIRWLRDHGRPARARRAEGLEHMTAPRPGGALAAMEGAPDANVVFAAHTGLGRAATGLQALLAGLPQEGPVRMRFWLAPAAERPRDEAGQVDWLDAWWARLDDWVEAQGEE